MFCLTTAVNLPPQALPADVAMAGVLCTVGTNAGWRSKRSVERLGMLKVPRRLSAINGILKQEEVYYAV